MIGQVTLAIKIQGDKRLADIVRDRFGRPARAIAADRESSR